MTREEYENNPNWIEPSTGIVHLHGIGVGGGEDTLCGLMWDEPLSERNEKPMEYTNKKCNCEDCIRIANNLIPYLKKQIRRIKEGNRNG